MDWTVETWEEDGVDRVVNAAKDFLKSFACDLSPGSFFFSTHIFTLLLTISQQASLGAKEGVAEGC